MIAGHESGIKIESKIRAAGSGGDQKFEPGAAPGPAARWAGAAGRGAF